MDVGCELCCLVGNLLAELARGHQHECLPSSTALRLGEDLVEGRQEVGEGFAGAGVGDGNHVRALQQLGTVSLVSTIC